MRPATSPEFPKPSADQTAFALPSSPLSKRDHGPLPKPHECAGAWRALREPDCDIVLRMRRPLLRKCAASTLTLALLSAFAGSAAAEGPDKPAASATGTGITANGIRRDPKGVQGVSPTWEAIGKGDGALLARDYDAAIAAYRDAVAKSPQNPLAFYRVAEAQKLKGDLKEAETAYNAALRVVGTDTTMKAKILFCLADLSERQKDFDQAVQRWTAYEAFVKSADKAKTYPASAAERKKRIQEWKQISTDAAAVKQRIEKRLQEVDATTRKNAAGGK
jgi:tetratricopeptide (TPR) repeat protein